MSLERITPRDEDDCSFKIQFVETRAGCVYRVVLEHARFAGFVTKGNTTKKVF